MGVHVASEGLRVLFGDGGRLMQRDLEHEEELRVPHAGGFFGGSAMCAGLHRQVSVVTKTKATLLKPTRAVHAAALEREGHLLGGDGHLGGDDAA